ncbi:MAG: AAA family ATPase [Nitrososphaerales archaeon]
MKIRRSQKAFDWTSDEFLWHLFLYGYPGCGKTKVVKDFQEVGFKPIVVATYQQDITLSGSNIPVLTVEHPLELMALVQKPKNVIEQVLWPALEEEYPVDLIMFDVLRDLQMLLFGESKTIKDTEVFDGKVTIEKTAGFGVMSEPNARDATGIPSPKDYRLLDLNTRALVKKIEKMPYHTITTAHAEVNFDERTHAKLTGDQKKDKEIKAQATIKGFPSLEGYSAKSDLPGIISDFMIYMDTPDQESFYMYPKSAQGFHARTRVAEFMPRMIDWTGKNIYKVLTETIEKGMERKKK